MIDLNKYILSRLDIDSSIHPVYKEAFSYILCSKGKHFRSNLFFILLNSYAKDLVLPSMDIAFAIEAVHTYSLIHDDLPSVDNSPLRRGIETLHVKYDEVTALLVGDALNSYAYELISKAELNDSIKIGLVKSLSYNSGANGMVLGQAIDCYFEDSKLEIDEVVKMHINKTGKLIASSLEMGAIISKLDSKLIKKIYSFGLDLGLLFQIQDDILDLVSNEKELGKPVHNDSAKNSFINIIGLKDSKAYADNLTSKIEKTMNGFDIMFKENLYSLLKDYIYRHRG